eukprot:scaffold42068_cov71-Phaeocystis_antarctica.AAC.2
MALTAPRARYWGIRRCCAPSWHSTSYAWPTCRALSNPEPRPLNSNTNPKANPNQVLHAAASLLSEADERAPTPKQTTQRELWALGQ